MKFLKIWPIVKLCKNWPAIFLHKIFRLPLLQIRLRNGIVFTVDGGLDTAELSILADVWFRHVYDQRFVKINPDDTVLDVGAHKGYFGIYAATKAYNGRVFCFEPVPSLAQFITKNISINKIKNLKVFNKAVWKETGDLGLFLSSNSGGHSVRMKPSTTGQITVDAITLEEFMEQNQIQRVDLLKLDCEGSEYDILLNLDPGTLERIKKITMESHDFGSFHHSQIEEFLAASGFKTKYHSGYLYAIKSD